MFKNIKPSIKDYKKNKFKLFFFVRNKFPYPIIEKINCVEIKKNIISKNIILIYQLIILIFLIYFFLIITVSKIFRRFFIE